MSKDSYEKIEKIRELITLEDITDSELVETLQILDRGLKDVQAIRDLSIEFLIDLMPIVIKRLEENLDRFILRGKDAKEFLENMEKQETKEEKEKEAFLKECEQAYKKSINAPPPT